MDAHKAVRTDRKLLNIELGRMTPEQYRSREERGLVLVLDNVRSAHNTGSAFRTADAFGVDRIYLGGITPAPPSPELHKVALGAEESVPSERAADVLSLVHSLREQGYVCVAVEQTVNSVSLSAFNPVPGARYALVFGNEVEGVSQDVVNACDFSLEIPQQGTKHSLNVSVSVGVVLWHIVNKL
ncbi:MAG: RNA methyltransferase [Bacteroidales bacterium]|nr:RNA methyltransferase [Bacteroidales bacterium]